MKESKHITLKRITYFRNKQFYLSAIKRGVNAKTHQIKDNPGGILLDISMSNIPNYIIKKQIISALKDTSVSGFMVIGEETIILLPYTKNKEKKFYTPFIQKAFEASLHFRSNINGSL